VDWRSLILRVKPALCVLLFVFSCPRVSATTVLVIVTPTGIVVAADTKVVSVDIGGYSAPPEGPTTKMFIIHGRIAVGTLGLGRQSLTTLDKTPPFSYDPPVWLRKIEKKTPRNISVRQFIDIVKSESSSTFSDLNRLIHTGAIKQEQAPELTGGQYIVSGFESGVAIVEEINFEVDWKNRQLVGPTVESVFPDPKARRVDFGFHAASRGYNDAVDDVLRQKADSKGFKLVSSEAGVELSILLARKDLTMNQASTLLHAFLRAQNKYTPKYVGPPYNIVWLRKDGTVNRINYSD
jgi:hypothetical protein